MSDADAAADDLWSRPLWTPGGGDPFVYFVVFGAEADLLEIDGTLHRVDEVPDGIDAHELGPEWVASFFEPPMGELLRLTDAEAAEASEASGSCIVVTGSVDDPATLGYLRDAIGITTAALDTGGTGVLSLQTSTLFGPDAWREEVFDGGRALVHRLVRVLVSSEDDVVDDDEGVDDEGVGPGLEPPDTARGRQWVHTRGLRVFGRPDLSIRGVEPGELEVVNQLLRALIAQLARGLVIDDGMTMDIGGEVGTLRFDRRGDLEDPDFNNEHLEISRS